MVGPQALTNDDLLWLIGQKEATLLLVTRQAQAILAENERLTAQNATLTTELTARDTHDADHRQTLDAPVSSETSA